MSWYGRGVSVNMGRGGVEVPFQYGRREICHEVYGELRISDDVIRVLRQIVYN